jgi:Na+/proline symporter
MGSQRSPLQDKVTGEHITEMLAIDREQLGRVERDRSDQRKHQTRLAVIACAFVLLLVGLLTYTGNSALTENVLSGLVGLAAGAFGGYGFGRASRE